MAQILQSYGTLSVLTSTNFFGLSSSTTTVWQSQLIDVGTTEKAIDYHIFIKAAMTTAAPTSDKAMYVYYIPWSSSSTVWIPTDIGTVTQVTGTEGTATINSSSQLRLLGSMAYVTAGQAMGLEMCILGDSGDTMLPDGFSLLIKNYTGTPVSTGNIITVRPMSFTSA